MSCEKQCQEQSTRAGLGFRYQYSFIDSVVDRTYSDHDNFTFFGVDSRPLRETRQWRLARWQNPGVPVPSRVFRKDMHYVGNGLEAGVLRNSERWTMVQS
jgi:hypothetical protein